MKHSKGGTTDSTSKPYGCERLGKHSASAEREVSRWLKLPKTTRQRTQAQACSIIEVNELWTLLPKKVQMRDLVALDLNFAKDFGYVSGKQMLKTSGELFRQLKGLATLGRCGTEDLADEHFIQAAMQCQRKRFITKIQSFNCRLSIYLARLHRRTLSYSKSKSTLAFSLKVLMHKLKNF